MRLATSNLMFNFRKPSPNVRVWPGPPVHALHTPTIQRKLLATMPVQPGAKVVDTARVKRRRVNIVVLGDTLTGKTTLLGTCGP